MTYIIFDTETTGLTAKDEVIQFAAIIADKNLVAKRIVNFWCYTQVPVSKEALAVHNIDNSKLYELSKGRTFEDNIEVVLKYVEDNTIWAGYNVPFDMRLCNQTLLNNGLLGIKFGTSVSDIEISGVHNFDVMRALAKLRFGRNVSLSKAIQSLPYSMEKIEATYKKFVNSEGQTYHDARFDAFATWMLMSYYKEQLKR